MAGHTTPELRRTWRRNWLASVRELSVPNWQRDLWGKSSNPHHSFDEYATVYWDDLLGSKGYGPFVADGLLSVEEAQMCAVLHNELDQYLIANPSARNVTVLTDPNWRAVVAAADETRTALLSIISTADERRELLRDEAEFP